MVRSGSTISAIFASTASSPSAFFPRAAAFSSWARSFIAPRSSSVNPSNFWPVVAVLSPDFCLSFIANCLPCRSRRGRPSCQEAAPAAACPNCPAVPSGEAGDDIEVLVDGARARLTGRPGTAPAPP
jgi:hypothetical protein